MVDISDGAALESIYVSKGGFSKPSWYHNAYVDGFSTIFSSTDLAYRATKARVVAPLFSNLAIYRDQKSLYQSVDHFVQALIRSKEASNGRHVDLQEHARALGLNVLSTYLFRHQPPRIQKLVNEGSMIPWLDFVVDIGQFFYLPFTLYHFCVSSYLRVHPQRSQAVDATKLVHEYTMNLPGGGENKTQSFQGRLLEQGFSKEEVAAECKSMMVAGIHSLGTVLSMIIYYLAKDAETIDRLRAEVSNHGCSGVDIQRIPFLQGVIKEGFRLAPANATRFPRVVPSMGWQFNGYYFPPGTVVGIANPQLFSDPDVYNEPMAFRPERWLDPSAKMQRDLVPFGLGIRQCIAKNLATAALFMAVEKVVESDVLKGAKPVKDPIEFWEWFNVAAKGNKVELVWPSG
ncbi:MAG: hypothetical protein LQ341_003837 [Variospora aurantia]|nr:MAG: hypothetical protein LQ341_003837 [Variospora aurantia]